jgi:imidazole glycerol-phosphate synthase subunit HisH
MGNLRSVLNALEAIGVEAYLAPSPEAVGDAERLILPGVGAFGDGMRNLRERGFVEAMPDLLDNGRPLLGICLGMQMLASVSEEHGEHEGLDLIPGTVRRLDPGGGLRVPHVGWNEVHQVRPSPLLDGIASGRDFYFVHSYALRCDDPADAVATVPYGEDVVAAVARGNVAGVQFHPEKSQKAGFQLLRNFLAAAERPVEPALTFSRPRR